MGIDGFIGCIIGLTTYNDARSTVLNRMQLSKLRLKALRAGVWFKALTRIDRVLIDLTIKVAYNIRSNSLAKSVMSVMSKLEGLLESNMLYLLGKVGHPLAEKISLVAQKLGNVSAKAWANDSDFAVFLAIMSTNK